MGNLMAAEVTIEGAAIAALIFADKVSLRVGSILTGEIWYTELVLEAGHLFEGKSRRHDDPKSLAPAQQLTLEEEEPLDEEPGDNIASV